mgnify:CR=1 FL=1
MKGKLQFPVSLCWFLPVLVFMLVSCGDDDDYHYPSVKLDFLTAQAGADGSLQSVLTDEGETLAIVEDASKTRIDALPALSATMARRKLPMGHPE